MFTVTVRTGPEVCSPCDTRTVNGDERMLPQGMVITTWPTVPKIYQRNKHVGYLATDNAQWEIQCRQCLWRQ